MGSNQLASLLKNGKITRVKNAVTAGTTDQDSDVLDMAGFDSICFISLLGDITSGSVLELQVFGNTANSTSSPTPVEQTNDDTDATAGASDYDNKLLIVDCQRWNPNYRYAFARQKRGTQNAVLDGMIAIQYNARDIPTTQGSTVGQSAVVSF